MSNTPTLQIGAEIERRRIEAGLTPPGLARKAGLSGPYMRLLEREKYSALPPTLLKISDALGCHIRDISRLPGTGQQPALAASTA